MKMDVFIDTDVIISSLLSTQGAAYLLLQQRKMKLYISSYSLKEAEIVVKRLDIKPQKLRGLIDKPLIIIPLRSSLWQIQSSYKQYVTDLDDAHIVAGAKEAKTKFLISYNIKHFKVDGIKRDLGITILTPGSFIQYLRSLQR